MKSDIYKKILVEEIHKVCLAQNVQSRVNILINNIYYRLNNTVMIIYGQTTLKDFEIWGKTKKNLTENERDHLHTNIVLLLLYCDYLSKLFPVYNMNRVINASVNPFVNFALSPAALKRGLYQQYARLAQKQIADTYNSEDIKIYNIFEFKMALSIIISLMNDLRNNTNKRDHYITSIYLYTKRALQILEIKGKYKAVSFPSNYDIQRLKKCLPLKKVHV